MHKVPSLSKKTIRGMALTVVVLLLVAVVSCPRVANAGAAIASLLLVLVTLEYVLTNQENVELFREQIEHQRGVFLDFGVLAENREPVLWIANLGIATFIIKEVIVGTKDKEFPWPTHLLVPAGEIEKLVFPDAV